MNVTISFTVQRSKEPNHRTDMRFEKVFDVDWPGRPNRGEEISLDIGPPGDRGENEFRVRGVYWSTSEPLWVYLEPIVVPADEEEQLQRYASSLESRGWKRSGGFSGPG